MQSAARSPRPAADTSLIGHRRILNEWWSSYLRGVAYTGDYEVPALLLVVDNVAALAEAK